MSATLMVCLGLVATAVAGAAWWVAFGLASRTDRLGEAVLAGLVGHLGQFEAELACAPDPDRAAGVSALAATTSGGAA